jgi:hypothetical protein
VSPEGPPEGPDDPPGGRDDPPGSVDPHPPPAEEEDLSVAGADEPEADVDAAPDYGPAVEQLVAVYEEWESEVDAAELQIRDFEKFMAAEESSLADSEATLDLLERTYAGVQEWIDRLECDAVDPAIVESALTEVKETAELLNRERRFRFTEPNSLKDYLRLNADVKARLNALDRCVRK